MTTYVSISFLAGALIGALAVLIFAKIRKRKVDGYLQIDNSDPDTDHYVLILNYIESLKNRPGDILRIKITLLTHEKQVSL